MIDRDHMNSAMNILPCGDSAVSLRFREEISPETHALVMAYMAAIEKAGLPGFIECVPSYCALMLIYDPMETSFDEICAAVRALDISASSIEASGETIVLPVCYGNEFGPDLSAVAAHAGLGEEEVIALHSSVDYPIYMLGFTPGFPYLGGMDARLATPRLKAPRTRVEAGSVGIAGAQTGVYPVASPGGWQIIGRTPARLYDPARREPFLLRAGQRLRFSPISAEEFARLSGGGK